MPITVQCPACQNIGTAPDAAAGRTVRCPKCNSPLTVPGGGEEPQEQNPAPVLAPASWLAIASGCLSVAGLLFLWSPLVFGFSLPLAGVALLLGGVSLLVSILHRSEPFSPPIALVLGIIVFGFSCFCSYRYDQRMNELTKTPFTFNQK